MKQLPSEIQHALLFHGLFFAITLPIASALRGFELGVALSLFALAYNFALPAYGKWRFSTAKNLGLSSDRLSGQNSDWVGLWQFLLPLSLSLPCADWMLVKQLGTLYFPDHGIPRIGGAVPVYFSGMWIMLLWPTTWLALQTRMPYVTMAVLSMTGFLVWEWVAPTMALWEPKNAIIWQGIAVYVLIPELLLGLATLFMWQILRNQTRLAQIAGGLGLTVFYAGALALSLLWTG
jgi:hypothetical protein